MDELQQLESRLEELDGIIEKGGDGVEDAKAEAQTVADRIHRLTSIEQTYKPSEGTSSDVVTQYVSRPAAGTLSLAGHATKAKLHAFLDKRAARTGQLMGEELTKKFFPQGIPPEGGAGTPATPKSVVVTGQTPAERLVQGTIDPETGLTGRARQTGYNQLSREQRLNRLVQEPIIQDLVRTGQITGENPLLHGAGFTSSTPSGVVVQPTAIEPVVPKGAAPATPAAEEGVLSRLATGAKNVASEIPGKALNVLKPATKALGAVAPYLGAYGVGSFGIDAAQRLYNKDMVGAGLSSLGTGAALQAMRGKGGLWGLGVMGMAELINHYRDNPEALARLKEYIGEANLGATPWGLSQTFAKGGHATAAWQRSEGKNPEGGLNAVGRASYHAETGGTLKPPVSAEQAKKSPKAAGRRKSFCARMSGMEGPMKDENGKPTRKALALRKWDC